MMCKMLLALALSLCVALGIAENPVIILSPKTIIVPQGGSVQLQCALVNGSVDNTNVQWKKYNQDLGISEKFQSSTDPKYNSYILTIRNVQKNDAGNYNCEITTKSQTIRGNTIQIDVRGANVPILSQPEVLNVREALTAQIQCSAQNVDLSRTDLHWFRRSLRGYETFATHRADNSVEMKEDLKDRFQSTRNISNNVVTLTITNIQQEDVSVYYCRVWSEVYGSGTQLNITEEVPLNLFVIIVPCLLIVLLLLVGALLIVFHIKRWGCFRDASTQSGDTDEGADITYATVSGQNNTDTLAARSPVQSNDDQVHYAELQLKHSKACAAVTPSETNSEYASVKRN
ncbi:junctional adhesion molecule C-like [Scyliorhinus torazame]|uniref:junctional adhesion molecule C-like n=1 Tax=Scyliorhinus torazame TaxID=75743 RepID=UPI003B5C44DA